jgi:pimeloyl-ACP methyl ester carboxylesterase
MTGTRPDQPGPMTRRGPRPLLLHLTLAASRALINLPSLDCTSGSPTSKPDWQNLPDWHHWIEITRRAATDPALASALTSALVSAASGPDQALIAGIAAYRRHDYQRTLADPPEIWAEGETRVLDYGGSGPVVLFVPSLVNRAYILDLDEPASFMRYLAAHGAHPLLLDWGWPGEVERQFTLTDYIAGRLDRALAAIEGPVVLAGFCMGGLLALASAQRNPKRISGLALLATPWDFHADNPDGARRLAASLAMMEPMLAASDTLPIDALQTLFAMLDPLGVSEKYRSFADLDPNSARAQRFVALEDWLNDGVPLPAPVARETLGQWYGANAPMRGQWRVAGLPVEPRQIPCPALIVAPSRDRLVPPDAAKPLAALIPRATLHEPQAGHIGMVAGMQAEKVLWQPFLQWLAAL